MGEIKEKFDGLRENFTADAREYTCTYTVKGKVLVTDFPQTFVWNCLGLSDPFAVLIGFGDTRQLGPNRFEVQLKYTTDPFGRRTPKKLKDPNPNPLARPPVQRWSTGYLERMEDRDLANPPNVFCASNWEMYEGGLAIRYPYLVKTYVRNEAFYDEPKALSTIWRMDSTKKILCAKFDGSEEFNENGIAYVQLTYEFWKLDPGGSITWDVVKLDCGSYSRDPTNWAHVIYPTDGAGTKSIAPGAVVLDGDGHAGDKESPNWNYFQVHLIANFAGLALPKL